MSSELTPIEMIDNNNNNNNNIYIVNQVKEGPHCIYERSFSSRRYDGIIMLSAPLYF